MGRGVKRRYRTEPTFGDRDPWENLATAIVMRAIRDYRAALRVLAREDQAVSVRQKNEAERARQTKEECEEFFRSREFTALSRVSGEDILEKLEEEADWL
ncbi:MAG: hypothetical protein LUC17_02045 [Oscillospiraceae bacterium]|nr:hypothetical protein [Oscillospiraceae bacterium]